MDLHKYEQFEIEVLEKLNSGRFLDPLVFGGGTMLRLCWGLPRYSVDLDFWFIKDICYDEFFDKIRGYLSQWYELTDSAIKFYSIVLELRSSEYPSKLKIEVRKGHIICDFEQRIAFSPYAEKQVLLTAHTLKQALSNKIDAALDRKIIRDFFDIEFLLRQGLVLDADKDGLERLKEIIGSFKERDFKVTLGSLLDKENRDYYIANGFSFLLAKINERLSMG